MNVKDLLPEPLMSMLDELIVMSNPIRIELLKLLVESDRDKQELYDIVYKVSKELGITSSHEAHLHTLKKFDLIGENNGRYHITENGKYWLSRIKT